MGLQHDIGVLQVQVDRSEGYAITACGALLVRNKAADTMHDDADYFLRSMTFYAHWTER